MTHPSSPVPEMPNAVHSLWARYSFVKAAHQTADIASLVLVSIEGDHNKDTLTPTDRLFLCSRDRVKGQTAGMQLHNLGITLVACSEFGTTGMCHAGDRCNLVHVDIPGGLFSSDQSIYEAALTQLPQGECGVDLVHDSAVIPLPNADHPGDNDNQASSAKSFVIMDATSGNFRVVDSTFMQPTIGLRAATALKEHPALIRFRSAHPLCCERYNADQNLTPTYGVSPQRQQAQAQGGCKLGASCPFLHIDDFALKPILTGSMPLTTLLCLHYLGGEVPESLNRPGGGWLGGIGGAAGSRTLEIPRIDSLEMRSPMISAFSNPGQIDAEDAITYALMGSAPDCDAADGGEAGGVTKKKLFTTSGFPAAPPTPQPVGKDASQSDSSECGPEKAAVSESPASPQSANGGGKGQGGDKQGSLVRLIREFCDVMLEEQGLRTVAHVNKITNEVFNTLTSAVRAALQQAQVGSPYARVGSAVGAGNGNGVSSSSSNGCGNNSLVTPSVSAASSGLGGKAGPQPPAVCLPAPFGRFRSLSLGDQQQILDFWMRLEEVRTLPDELSVEYALSKFGYTLSLRWRDVLQQHALNTIKDLRKMKFSLFLAIPLPAYVVSVLQTIRERRRVKESSSPFEVVDLPCKMDPTINKIVTELMQYQYTIDGSWKKSGNSQIVTTAITYAPRSCSCVKGFGQRAYRMQPYPASSSLISHLTRWCSCTRSVVFSTNYELSTPSGSRCSEQNGLGKIASMGLPTSCIREVYVRGWRDSADDPNPLFPCGVCETMFKKLSKDVYRKHRAEISLFMFDSQSDTPKKLITMPFSEISNRASQRFKSFVDTELREDD